MTPKIPLVGFFRADLAAGVPYSSPLNALNGCSCDFACSGLGLRMFLDIISL